MKKVNTWRREKRWVF